MKLYVFMVVCGTGFLGALWWQRRAGRTWLEVLALNGPSIGLVGVLVAQMFFRGWPIVIGLVAVVVLGFPIQWRVGRRLLSQQREQLVATGPRDRIRDKSRHRDLEAELLLELTDDRDALRSAWLRRLNVLRWFGPATVIGVVAVAAGSWWLGFAAVGSSLLAWHRVRPSPQE